ncbi:MAG: 50S ribosomal protein L10 [Anaerolineae bacterium]|nr:50S ribosomal protein L10 [Anaerolineae bacterium]
MAITREKKEELIAQYVQEINDSEGLIITEYRGLSVQQIQELRSKIREAEGSYAVVKNTLARRALAEAGINVDSSLLTGPIGIGFCHQNLPGVAKAVTDFAKSNDKMVVRGGLIGSSVIDEAGVKELTKLPPIEVVRAQLLGLLNTPASQLVGVLNAPASQFVGVLSGGVRQVVNVLNAYATKNPEEAA